MKKIYIKPEITVHKMNYSNPILAASDGDGISGNSVWDEETDQEEGF